MADSIAKINGLLKLNLYLTLLPKYKLDDNHKTNIDTFEFFSLNCKLITAAAYNE